MKTPNITEEEIGIIKDAQKGDERAFTKLFYRYKNMVESILYQYLKDIDEARDLTNIVFLKLNNKLSKFKDYSSFGGWLRILTKNTAIDYLRIQKNEVSIDANDDLQLSSEDNESTMINKMTYDHLMSLINTLPPSYRDTCILFYGENMTVAQISKALNIPSGTIKSNLYRMRKQLQKLLTI